MIYKTQELDIGYHFLNIKCFQSIQKTKFEFHLYQIKCILLNKSYKYITR
jgi:hypothetical protein